MAIDQKIKEKVKELLDLGLSQGYLTQDEVLDYFPEIEEDLTLLDYIVSSLQENEIEIIEPVDEVDKEVAKPKPKSESQMTFEQKIAILKKIRSHVSTDPIRAYLHET